MAPICKRRCEHRARGPAAARPRGFRVFGCRDCMQKGLIFCNPYHILGARESEVTTTPSYFTQTSGSCDHPVVTSAECDTAANVVGYSNSGSRSDGSWTHAPPGCSHFYGGFGFNSNTGSMTSCAWDLNCICATRVPTLSTVLGLAHT